LDTVDLMALFRGDRAMLWQFIRRTLYLNAGFMVALMVSFGLWKTRLGRALAVLCWGSVESLGLCYFLGSLQVHALAFSMVVVATTGILVAVDKFQFIGRRLEHFRTKDPDHANFDVAVPCVFEEIKMWIDKFTYLMISLLGIFLATGNILFRVDGTPLLQKELNATMIIFVFIYSMIAVVKWALRPLLDYLHDVQELLTTPSHSAVAKAATQT
jgi:hypothetical protein